MIVDLVTWGRLGRGGMEMVLERIATEMASRGIVVRLVLFHSLKYPEWLNHFPKVIHLQDCESTEKRALKEAYDTHGFPDVCLTADLGLEAVCRRVVGNRSLIFSWPHSSMHYYYQAGLDIAAALSHANGLMAISSGIGEQCRRFVPDLNVSFVGNPVPTDVSPVSRPFGIKEFLFIGRLNEEKRPAWVLRALKQLERLPWRLTIIGSGDLDAQLKQQIAQLRLGDRVRWHPFQADPWSKVQEASALLMASSFEGFGLVMVEALARGIPVISSDCPTGPPDIVQDEQNGYLYDMNDFDALVDVLRNVLEDELPLPPMEDCIASAQRYAPSAVVDRMIAAIDELSFSSISHH